MSTPRRMGIFGLGIIGRIWADHLHRDGLEVRTWNRTAKPEAPGFADDPADVARAADLLVIVVADPPAVQQVLDRVAHTLRAGQLVVQSSTIGPEHSRRFAAQVQSAGAAFLEAPFTGSKPAAEQRQTVFYVGGEAAALDRARPVLERLSRTILHIGEVGSASALKLAMNIHIAMVAEALCESLAYARAAGISDETYFNALKLNVAQSGVAALKEPKLRSADYSPHFSVKHMAKDIRLAKASSGALALPQTDAVLKVYEAGLAAGFGDDDFIGLTRLIRGA